MANYKQELWSISNIPKNIEIAYITADFNKNYTDQLEEITSNFLSEQHFRNITSYRVPGALEIPGMLKRVLELKKYDLVYCFGVVIRWETSHYDIVCNESARGFMNLSVTYETPIIFGVLTCENTKQVEARINNSLAISGLNLLSQSLNV